MMSDVVQPVSSVALPNGRGAAAVLAAGVGSFALGVLAVAGDRSKMFGQHLIFYRPTGPLSGVTTVAIAIWLVTWALLAWRWRSKSVRLRPVLAAAFVLLALSLLLTFPPLADLL